MVDYFHMAAPITDFSDLQADKNSDELQLQGFSLGNFFKTHPIWHVLQVVSAGKRIYHDLSHLLSSGVIYVIEKAF